MPLRWIALVASTLFAASSVAAAPRKPKAMVLEIPPDKSLDANLLRALNDFLAGAVRDQGFAVITPADVGAALGLERQKELLGCNDNTSCMSEIGGALGADYLVRGTAAVLDRDTALTLTVTDARGVALNQVREFVPSHSTSDLVHALDQLVPKLMAPLQPKVAPPPVGALTTSTPVATPESSPSRLPAYATWAGAGVLAVGAVIATVAASQQFAYVRNNYGRPGYDASREATLQHVDWLADGLWAGTLVAGGVGGYLFFTAAPAGGGGEVGVGGQF